MLRCFRWQRKSMLCLLIMATQATPLWASQGVRTAANFRLLGAVLNGSAPYLLPFSGAQLKAGLEADLGIGWSFLNNQQLFYQMTPVWRANRSEKGVYSDLGYQKTFEASQIGLHFFADWNTLAPTDYLHSQWGFGIEWSYLQKHRWSLISTGYTWGKDDAQPNPSVKSVEGVYLFQSELKAARYRFSLHYFLDKATLIHDAQKAYDRPIKGALRAQFPLRTDASILSRFALLFEPSYIKATTGKASDLSIKLGVQFSLGSQDTTLHPTGSLRSLIRPTTDASRLPSHVTIKEQHTAYVVYPILDSIASDHAAPRGMTTGEGDTAVSIEASQAIQDFWNNNQFTWRQTSAQGTVEVVGEGPVLLKEGLKEGPISVYINEGTDSPSPVEVANYTPSEPTVIKHTDPEDYDMGNLLTIYSTIVVEPSKPDEYGLLPLTVQHVRDTIPNRELLLGYNAEKIIAVQNEAGAVELQNWTPRTIINPVIEINSQYYRVLETTLNPYQTLTLGPSPKNITSLNFVDPSPLGKWTVTEFENLENAALFSSNNEVAVGDLMQMEAHHIANFNAILCTYKRILNRLDLCEHLFNVINQKVPSLGALVPNPDYIYHILRPEGRVGYALHGCKATLALPWRSIVGGYKYGYATGAADGIYVHEGKITRVRFIERRLTEPVIFDTLAHEMNHTYGYGHEGGLTYGWTDEIQQYLDTYYVPEGLIPRKEDPIPGTRSAETQRYFATYTWPDATHIDVQFYALDKLAPPLVRFLILSWDESFVPSKDNKYAPIFDSHDNGTLYSGEAVVQDYGQLPYIEQINGNRLQISLCQTRISHGSSIVLLASAVSEPPYALDDSLALIIYPRVRRIIVPAVDFSKYAWAADDRSGPPHPWNMNSYDAVYMELTEEGYHSLFLDSGNTGHVGRESEADVDYLTLAPHQGFLPHAKYYKSFSIQSAQEQAIALGYTGLGTYPTEPSTQLMSKFACQFMHLSRVLGLDPTTQEPCLVEYSGFENATPLTETDTATLLFLKR